MAGSFGDGTIFGNVVRERTLFFENDVRGVTHFTQKEKIPVVGGSSPASTPVPW
eukprot:JP437173.1.p2 GENE.JP437173.1~~JP437173.1.p2  ORF type:complete len:54 (+),score=2.71 JP437173.1:189-350(+)